MRAFVEKRPAGYAKLRQLAADGACSEMPWGAYAVDCSKCGAVGIPEEFKHCGACGAAL
jgi:hypothetical protein